MNLRKITKRIFDNAGYIENMIVASLIAGTCGAFALSYVINGNQFSWMWFCLLELFMPSATLVTLLTINWLLDLMFRPLHKHIDMERWGTFYTLCLLTTPVGGIIYIIWKDIEDRKRLMDQVEWMYQKDYDYECEDYEEYESPEDDEL